MEIFITLAIVALVAFIYFKFFKIPKLKSVIFVDGSLGTGKSFYSVYLAIRLYKRNLRHAKITNLIIKLLRKIPLKRFKNLKEVEEPLLFSNIPLAGVKHCKITKDLLLRKKRFPYQSIVLLDEISLIVDQFDYKDREVSDRLRDFMKLFRHEAGNKAKLIINSQSTSDLHYSVKAVLSDYIYLHHKTKLPFFTLLAVREMGYSSDKDAQNVTNEVNADIEQELKHIIVPNRAYKKYDSRCYSILTDELEVSNDWVVLGKKDSLKTKVICTFKEDKRK